MQGESRDGKQWLIEGNRQVVKQHEGSSWERYGSGKKNKPREQEPADGNQSNGAESELRKQEIKAAAAFKQLPKRGKAIWKVIKETIRETLNGDLVHFEGALRKALENTSGFVGMTR